MGTKTLRASGVYRRYFTFEATIDFIYLKFMKQMSKLQDQYDDCLFGYIVLLLNFFSLLKTFRICV